MTQVFVDRCQRNHLQINVGNTEKLIVDSPPILVNIEGMVIETVESVPGTQNTNALYRNSKRRPTC